LQFQLLDNALSNIAGFSFYTFFSRLGWKLRHLKIHAAAVAYTVVGFLLEVFG